MSDQTVGFIDIGTNSIHLLVVKYHEGTIGTEVAREKETIRIGRSLYSKGTIDGDALAKCSIVVKSFVEYAKKHGAREVIAFATCAAREAENRDEFLKAIKTNGLKIKIIPGEEEARIIKLGVLGITAPHENTLLIDIGGGSTEFSISNGDRLILAESVPMGAVRYAYDFPFDCMKPITDQEYASYQREAYVSARRTMEKIKEIGFKRAIGSSGTFETFGELCAQMNGGNPDVLRLSDLSQTVKKLSKLDADGRVKTAKVGSNRADIIVSGGAIAEEVMSFLGIEQLEISHFGLKEGMRVDYRINHGMEDINIRDSSVKEICCKCGYDRGHAEKVKGDAQKLLDRLNEMGVTVINGHMRQMLGYASEMHDIGELFGYDDHGRTSASIVKTAKPMGFDLDEIEMMSIMIKYHHKKVPSADSEIFSLCDPRDVKDIRACMLILKIADAIDRYRMQYVSDFAVEAVKDGISIRLISGRDTAMEKWKIEKMSKEFEKIFERKLIVE